MKQIKLIIIVIGFLILPNMLWAQNISDYLILQDIGSYIRKVQTKDFRTLQLKTIQGYTITKNAGVLMGADHFLLDHDDKNNETVYDSDVTDLSVKVQVTQHAGADSDRWLMHEVEDNYRDGDDEDGRLGLPTDGAVVRKIENNRVLWLGIGGGSFRWMSNNVVIHISYTDLQGAKPEPIAVVQAYLAKFPSTITVTDAEFKSNAYNIKWIKDEMERRLRLCDKWNIQNQAGKVTPKDMIYSLSRSLEVFIHYRQKYYGVSADTELKALRSYKMDSDLPGLQTKLTQYKTWWNANKGKSISLP